MKEPVSQLQQIKDFIREHGPTAIAKRTKLSRRTIQYIASGDSQPNYATFQKLLKAMDQI